LQNSNWVGESNIMKNQLFFLDCTVRDGSYVVNFSYTCNEIAGIISGLEEAGVPLIEIGHGIGLGAWRRFKKPIGFEPKKFKQAVPYIEKAKALNMIVSVNFMKSYTESPKTFAQIAKRAWSLGIDYVYLVDSAGGMLPEDIKSYMEELFSAVPEIKVGFHGHNNLGLAIINSLTAIEQGATLIDVSLMGIGRGGGNTYFEQLISILLKKGYPVNIDLFMLLIK